MTRKFYPSDSIDTALREVLSELHDDEQLTNDLRESFWNKLITLDVEEREKSKVV